MINEDCWEYTKGDLELMTSSFFESGFHPVLLPQILQYMCENDNPSLHSLRDGTKRGNQNTAGGEEERTFRFRVSLGSLSSKSS